MHHSFMSLGIPGQVNDLLILPLVFFFPERCPPNKEEWAIFKISCLLPAGTTILSLVSPITSFSLCTSSPSFQPNPSCCLSANCPTSHHPSVLSLTVPCHYFPCTTQVRVPPFPSVFVQFVYRSHPHYVQVNFHQ